jgi:mannose-1-phosphate guanylyltransferase/mannose-6-phosphate isomerase
LDGIIKVRPVILCGGSGTRLWPLSRTGFPKQFLCLTGKESLFQEAAKRLMGLLSESVHICQPFIATNEEHRFLALEQLREISVVPDAVLLESVARNTAPALTLAALAAVENGEDPVMVVAPADQSVTEVEAFNSAMHCAIRQAAEGAVVILGITPDRPETGYGYIQIDAEAEKSPLAGGGAVLRFVEKPDATTAQAYIDQGGYYWNAGIFVLRASVWLATLQHFRPHASQASQEAWQARQEDQLFVRPGKQEFASIPAESIDYAVMERCPGSMFPLVMVPLSAGWSDLGAWDAVWKVIPKDDDGNAHFGDVLTADCRNNLVHAGSRLIGLVGVSDLVVVETADAVLVADRSRSQDVKRIVEQLYSEGRSEHVLHRKVHRPWGWYDSIDEADRFKVKRIMVKPGASLSLQKHLHRAEHWIVVNGVAEVTCGEKKISLTKNQSTYIPQGEVHCLANPGTSSLEIIEVQSGSYLGEDDIIRLADIYGRG